jgi:hypothetical protein
MALDQPQRSECNVGATNPPIEETALAQDTCGKGENDRGRLSEDEISDRDGISTLGKENRHRVKTLGAENRKMWASVTATFFFFSLSSSSFFISLSLSSQHLLSARLTTLLHPSGSAHDLRKNQFLQPAELCRTLPRWLHRAPRAR